MQCRASVIYDLFNHVCFIRFASSFTLSHPERAATEPKSQLFVYKLPHTHIYSLFFSFYTHNVTFSFAVPSCQHASTCSTLASIHTLQINTPSTPQHVNPSSHQTLPLAMSSGSANASNASFEDLDGLNPTPSGSSSSQPQPTNDTAEDCETDNGEGATSGNHVATTPFETPTDTTEAESHETSPTASETPGTDDAPQLPNPLLLTPRSSINGGHIPYPELEWSSSDSEDSHSGSVPGSPVPQSEPSSSQRNPGRPRLLMPPNPTWPNPIWPVSSEQLRDFVTFLENPGYATSHGTHKQDIRRFLRSVRDVPGFATSISFLYVYVDLYGVEEARLVELEKEMMNVPAVTLQSPDPIFLQFRQTFERLREEKRQRGISLWKRTPMDMYVRLVMALFPVCQGVREILVPDEWRGYCQIEQRFPLVRGYRQGVENVAEDDFGVEDWVEEDLALGGEEVEQELGEPGEVFRRVEDMDEDLTREDEARRLEG
jgi:hypothetical protein